MTRGSEASKKIATKEDIVGVVSMRRIMNVVVEDERLSVQALTAKYPTLVSSYNPVVAMKEEQRSYANKLASDEGVGKRDVVRATVAVTLLAACGLFLSQSDWLHEHAQLGMIGIFTLGYVGIIFEEVRRDNRIKAALGDGDVAVEGA